MTEEERERLIAGLRAEGIKVDVDRHGNIYAYREAAVLVDQQTGFGRVYFSDGSHECARDALARPEVTE